MFKIGDIVRHKDAETFHEVSEIINYNWFRDVNSDEVRYMDNYEPISKNYCLHEWVNVGFHFDKFVCKKCNEEKV